jgi:adenylate kinase
MRNLILLAVQGAGKGTLAKKLKEKYGYAHISTGDILREKAAMDDDLGREIKNLIDNGIFVSNDIIFKAIGEKITSDECKNGFIMDGCPRNLEQAKLYDEMVEKLGIDGGIAINMTIDDELLLQRMTGRRICKGCGAIYNIYNEKLTPKKEGICDNCGGELYQREDDSDEEAIRTRVETYYKVTTPVIDYYREKGNLYEVDSTDADKTLADVEEILKNLGD